MACSRAAALHMVDHGGGVIVNVASGAGLTPGVGMLPYRSAKAGVAHFTRCLAVELGQHGIRANCVAPANIATEINAAFDKAAVTRLQPLPHQGLPRSEEHTSELQSLMRISYAVFCLKTKNNKT